MRFIPFLKVSSSLPTLSIDDHFQNFLAVKSECTRRSYKGLFKEWWDFCIKTKGDVSNPSPKTVFGYVSEMLQKPGESCRYTPEVEEVCCPSTVWRKVTVLRAVYGSFPGNQKNPFEEPYQRLKKNKGGFKRPTEVISAHQVQQLFKAIDTRDKAGERDLAFISLLFGAGLRINEALNLRISDVRQEADITYFVLSRNKSRRPDEQAIDEVFAAHIWRYINTRILEGALISEPLLIKYRGRKLRPDGRMSAKSAYTLFKEIAAGAGLPPNISPHSGRATAATQLLLSGNDYGSVKDFLRHESFGMVSKYDHRLRVRKNHPGLKLKY